MGNYQNLIGIRDDGLIEGGCPPIPRKPIEIVHDALHTRELKEPVAAVVPRLVLWLLDDRYPNGGRWKGWRVGIEGNDFLPEEILETVGKGDIFQNPATYVDFLPSEVLGGVAYSRERGEYIKLHPGNILCDPLAWKSAAALTLLIMGSGDRHSLYIGDFPAYVICPNPMESVDKLRATHRTLQAVPYLWPPRRKSKQRRRIPISPDPWYLENRIIGRWSQTHVEILDSQDIPGAKDIGEYIYWVVNAEVTPLPPMRSIFCATIFTAGPGKNETTVSLPGVILGTESQRREDVVAFRGWEDEEEMALAMSVANCPTVWMANSWAYLVLSLEMAKSGVAITIWQARKSLDWEKPPFTAFTATSYKKRVGKKESKSNNT